MATHEEPSGFASPPKNSTIVIAILVPAVLVIVFLTLVIMNRRRGFLIPRIIREEDPAVRAERMKMRQSELESSIQSQHFYDWLASQKEKNPESLQTTDPLCAICLEDFDDDAQIRGLHCCHAYHSKCLDEWYSRYNEFCPLCHRPIVPGARIKRPRRTQGPLPVILMV